MEEALAPSLTPTEWRRAAASIAAYAAVAPDAALAPRPQAPSRRGCSSAIRGRVGVPLGPAARGGGRAGRGRGAARSGPRARARRDRRGRRSSCGPSSGDTRSPSARAARALALLARARQGQPATTAPRRSRRRWRATWGGRGASDEPLRDQIERALQRVRDDRREGGVRPRARRARRGAGVALRARGGHAGGGRRRGTRRLGRAAHVARRAARPRREPARARRAVAPASARRRREAARMAEDALDPLRDRMAEWILAREATPLAGRDRRRARRTPGALAAPAARAAAPRRQRHGRRRRRSRSARRACARAGLRIVRALRRPLRARSAVARAAHDRRGAGPRARRARARRGAATSSTRCSSSRAAWPIPAELSTLAEASMDPDLVHVLEHYARFAEAVDGDAAGALPAFDVLTRDIAPDASGRIEALRTALRARGRRARRHLVGRGAARSRAAERSRARGGDVARERARVASRTSRSAQPVASIPSTSRPDRRPRAAHRRSPCAVTRVLAGVEPTLGETRRRGCPRRAVWPACRGRIAKLVGAQVWRLVELPVDGSKPPEPPRACA